MQRTDNTGWECWRRACGVGECRGRGGWRNGVEGRARCRIEKGHGAGASIGCSRSGGRGYGMRQGGIAGGKSGQKKWVGDEEEDLGLVCAGQHSTLSQVGGNGTGPGLGTEMGKGLGVGSGTESEWRSHVSLGERGGPRRVQGCLGCSSPRREAPPLSPSPCLPAQCRLPCGKAFCKCNWR